MFKLSLSNLAVALCFLGTAFAAPAACPTLSSPVAAPSVRSGYYATLVANGLTKPRSMIFDTAGNLLVVQQYSGVIALTFANNNGCVSVASKKAVINDTSLNHGIEFSSDGKTLFVSNSNNVYSYGYDASSIATTTSATTLITNMTNPDHVSRTLYMSKFAPNTLLVSRGSGANLDAPSAIKANGRAQVKAFDLSTITSPVNYQASGKLLGWGLRNDVGVTEHPVTGGIYTVENSADELVRQGVAVHNNNPGEEMNYLGTLNNNVSPNQGSNFGYPTCFSVWNRTELPDSSALKVGQQFAINNLTPTNNDTICKSYTAPRLVFQAHQAPIDLKFNPSGTRGWVTFRGSWDRTVPVGYKLSMVFFSNGEPQEPSTSLLGAIDVVSNANTAACYSTTCFRPAGLAFAPGAKGLYFSSDATGEIYLVRKTSGKGF